MRAAVPVHCAEVAEEETLSPLREGAMTMRSWMVYSSAALLAVTAPPLAGQDGDGTFAVQLQMRDSGLGILDMKADVGISTRVEPFGLTVRVRTSEGTLECFNEFTIYSGEWAEIDCHGVYPPPPLEAVSGVTAEVDPSSLPELELPPLSRLFAPSLGFLCAEATREDRWARLGRVPPHLYICTARGSP